MVRSGTNAKSADIVGDVDFHVTDTDRVNRPINITIQLENGAQAYPVKWTDVYYRLFDSTTNTTSTHHIDSCNPVPNQIQGTTPLGIDGLYKCPTIYKCILSTDCTDDLAPREADYIDWPDLRCCICNKTITLRTDIEGLTGTFESQLVDAKATVIDSFEIVQDNLIVGNLQCNSFIDRQINCQLPRLITNSITQCTNEPIPCLAEENEVSTATLGYAFGAFWNQNPSFVYNIERQNWTQAHYEGIASIMNYQMYSIADQLVDPFTSKVFYDYLWFNLSDFELLSSPAQRANVWFQADIIQAQPFNFLSGSFPPPYTTPYTYFDPEQFSDCAEGAYNQNITACLQYTWDYVTDIIQRYPSYIEVLPIQELEYIYSLDVYVNYNFTAIEVFNINGESCGKALSPVIAETLTFYCINSNNNSAPALGTAGFLVVAFHGVGFLFDVPGIRLSSLVREIVGDPLASLLDLYPYGEQTYLNMIYAMLYFIQSVDDSIQFFPFTTTFPQRHSAYYTLDEVQSTTYRKNYTLGAVDILQRELIQDMKNAILVNNTYPYNTALAERVERQYYQSTPVDYENEDHLQFLYQVWATWLAPRHCSETTECMTMKLGKCIFAENTGPKQYWHNGESPPGYEIPSGAKEGGCNCHNDFQQGYYDFYLFCSRCKQGYGPLDRDEWAKMIQRNELISETFPLGTAPFVSEPTIEEFESTLACRFPVQKDPIPASFIDFGMCSNHGMVSTTTTDSEVELTIYPFGNYLLTPTCTALLVDSTSLHELYPPTDIHNLVYFYSTTSIISIINEAVYANSTICSLETLQELPLRANLYCGSQTILIECINENFFSPNSISYLPIKFLPFNDYTMYLAEH